MLSTDHPWWRHQMEAFSALPALYEGNPPVTGVFPSQRPVTQSFDVFFDKSLNKWLSKEWRRRWFKTPLRSLWRHCNPRFHLWFVLQFVFRTQQLVCEFRSVESAYIYFYIEKNRYIKTVSFPAHYTYVVVARITKNIIPTNFMNIILPFSTTCTAFVNIPFRDSAIAKESLSLLNIFHLFDLWLM